MDRRHCEGKNKQGQPCGAHPIKNRPYCLKHDPDLANERAEWDRIGGRNKSTANRAAKRMPSDLQDALQALYRTLSALESGQMPPARATAIATVCKAIVSVFEMGDAERRINEIEAMLKAKTA